MMTSFCSKNEPYHNAALDNRILIDSTTVLKCIYIHLIDNEQVVDSSIIKVGNIQKIRNLPTKDLETLVNKINMKDEINKNIILDGVEFSFKY